MSHVLDKTACRLTGSTARAAIAAAAMALMASLVPSPAHAAQLTRVTMTGTTIAYVGQCGDGRSMGYRFVDADGDVFTCNQTTQGTALWLPMRAPQLVAPPAMSTEQWAARRMMEAGERAVQQMQQRRQQRCVTRWAEHYSAGERVQVTECEGN